VKLHVPVVKFPYLCNLVVVKCIESEDGKNDNNYTFGYRSNCQTLLKRLYFYKIIKMFPLEESILHQKHILFFIKMLERETVKVFVLKFSHTVETCKILASVISVLSA
jgi:hypothetical protein